MQAVHVNVYTDSITYNPFHHIKMPQVANNGSLLLLIFAILYSWQWEMLSFLSLNDIHFVL